MTTRASHGRVVRRRPGARSQGSVRRLRTTWGSRGLVGALAVGRREGRQELVGGQRVARRGHAHVRRRRARSARRRWPAGPAGRSRRPSAADRPAVQHELADVRHQRLRLRVPGLGGGLGRGRSRPGPHAPPVPGSGARAAASRPRARAAVGGVGGAAARAEDARQVPPSWLATLTVRPRAVVGHDVVDEHGAVGAHDAARRRRAAVGRRCARWRRSRPSESPRPAPVSSGSSSATTTTRTGTLKRVVTIAVPATSSAPRTQPAGAPLAVQRTPVPSARTVAPAASAVPQPR